MVEKSYPTWVSQDRDRKNNMAVTDANAAGGVRYVILYSLHPSQASDLDVELVVKSAFEKDVANLQNLKKFGVRQMIKKCYFQGVQVP